MTRTKDHGEQRRVVAANVRRLREAARLSLGQLATRSGVSKAALSRLELATTNPTLETLAMLAAALSTTVAQLVTLRAPGPVVVVRAGEGADVSDSAGDGRLVHVQRSPTSTVEVHELVFPAGREETSATHGDGAWEHVLLLDGTASVGPLADTVLLGRGDYAVYPADQAHRYRAEGATPARLLLFLVTPAHGRGDGLG